MNAVWAKLVPMSCNRFKRRRLGKRRKDSFTNDMIYT